MFKERCARIKYWTFQFCFHWTSAAGNDSFIESNTRTIFPLGSIGIISLQQKIIDFCIKLRLQDLVFFSLDFSKPANKDQTPKTKHQAPKTCLLPLPFTNKDCWRWTVHLKIEGGVPEGHQTL